MQHFLILKEVLGEMDRGTQIAISLTIVAILFSSFALIHSQQGINRVEKRLNELESLLLVKAEIIIDYGNGTKTTSTVELPKNSTLLDALRKVAVTEEKKFDFGILVESINGVKNNPSTKKFWIWYIFQNNQWKMGQVGADQEILQNNAKYKWSYEAYSS